MTTPVAFARRTPLRRLLEQKGARWASLGDAAVTHSLQGATEIEALAIADLSPLPRLGFKGAGTIEAARKRGIELDATPNRAFRQADGSLCLVLARSEIILLSNLEGEGKAMARLEADWTIEEAERTYPMPRRDGHAWLLVAGPAAPAMFAKICAVDLRLDRFADLAIAQTSIAKMSAIVTRADIGTTPAFHVLADSAAALYFCGCICDAAEEFACRMVGLGALQDLEKR